MRGGKLGRREEREEGSRGYGWQVGPKLIVFFLSCLNINNKGDFTLGLAQMKFK